MSVEHLRRSIPTGSGTSGRKGYTIADGPANVGWLRSQIGAGPLGGMYLRGGQLVHTALIGEAGYVAPRHSEDDNGPMTVAPVSKVALSTRVGDAFDVQKCVVRKDGTCTWKPAYFPVGDCERILETLDTLPYVEVLRGVTHTPIARADRGLLASPGYDRVSGYLYVPTVELSGVPHDPTAEQVAAATEFLRWLVGEFVWGDDHSEANFWGAMLTPLLRLVTPPPYKLVALTARERGSGKGLLARLLCIVHGGKLGTWPATDEEVEKVIGGVLYCTTAPIVQIDNVRGTLQSARLEALATSASYDTRILGSTNRMTLNNDRLWVFTGNNMVIGGDLGRRMLWIDLDPKVEKPETRTGFAIPDLAGEVRARRAEVLSALLTWVAAWDARGRPTDTAATTSDDYGKWVAAVRSILSIAGVQGVFDEGTAARAADANSDEAEWAEFLEEWLMSWAAASGR